MDTPPDGVIAGGPHIAWDKAADGVRPGTVWVDGVQKQITTSDWPTGGDEVERVGTTSSDHVGQILVPSDTYIMNVDGTDYRMYGAIKTFGYRVY